MSLRFLLSAAATVGLLALASPGLASGPCESAGCWPAEGQCKLLGCDCLEEGGCICDYECDTNNNGVRDRLCQVNTSKVDFWCWPWYEPVRPIIV